MGDFEMVENLLDENELTLLSDIGITIRRKISGDENDYTKVFKGKYTNVKGVTRDVAVKIIHRELAPVVIREKFLPRELEIVQLLRHHENVIKTILINQSNTTDYIVTELARRDLYDTVRIKGPLSHNYSCRYFHNLIAGLKYLHSIQIAHRDIKCENCLIGMDGTLKLGDFGLARKMKNGELSKTFCGSTDYAAPELFRQKEFDPFPADIWSCGIVLFVMLSAELPFGENSQRQQIRSKSVDLQIPISFPDIAVQVLKRIFKFNPDERIDIKCLDTFDWLQPADIDSVNLLSVIQD